MLNIMKLRTVLLSLFLISGSFAGTLEVTYGWSDPTYRGAVWISDSEGRQADCCGLDAEWIPGGDGSNWDDIPMLASAPIIVGET